MKNKTLEQLGKNIQNLRRLHGYSQEEFAEQIGIATNTLSSIERGFAFMTVNTLERISETLKVQPYELFYSSEPKNEIEMYDYIIGKLEIIKNNNYNLSMLYKIVKSLFG
ncbi:helix-turn-helix transcriptional regulator [bacterium]|nr:helix-turn-helix transcriptional regulator [bacterium]